MFPCFDQPNIKGHLSLNVICPSTWKVFSNEDETKSELVSNDMQSLSSEEFNFLIEENALINKNYKLTSFGKTDKLSSYLYAFAAGEYAVFENKLNPDFRIKLRVMYRDSLKAFDGSEEMIRVTMAGFDFYEKYFGIDYPFKKYDQIFCPEYNMGAMENVGLVTYNEVYIWRAIPTLRMKTNFAITVLHELAHMWFGNLVTMDWWDDLWLNEAFATFISHLAMDCQLKESYSISWLLFNYYKGFAYKIDQSEITHPVMSEVENTEVTDTNFDSITYEKGSSIVKQMYYLIGHDNFSKALTKYFNEFKYTNTTFDDFIGKMEEVCKGISNLSYNWLKKSGLTSIIPKYQVDNGLIIKFIIEQKACLEEHNNLQTLVSDILFIYSKDNSLEYREFKNITINPAEITELNLLHGVSCPDAIILNHNDWAYSKLLIDLKSLEFLKLNLNKIDSLLTKQMVYRAIFDMMRDSLISGIEYVDLITELLENEYSEDIISPQLRYLGGAIENYIPIEYSEEYSNKVFNLCMNILCKLTDNKELLLTILNQIPSAAQSKQNIEILLNWIDQSTSETISFDYKGSKISFLAKYLSQQYKFTIIKNMHSSGYFNEEILSKYLNQELEKESTSEDSQNTKFYCMGATTDTVKKDELWNKIVNQPNSNSLPLMKRLMSGFVSKHQLSLIKPYLIEKFFSSLEHIATTNDRFYVEAFINNFSPSYFVSNEIIEKMKEHSKLLKKFDSASRCLLENADQMKRQLTAYNKCYDYLSKK